MKKMHLNLANCYGISNITQVLDFTIDNAVVLYAPNGTMKTSLANTFKDLSLDRLPSDRVYGLPTICEIKDETNNLIDKDAILVISPFEQTLTKEQGKLMADPILQQRYITLHANLIETKQNLFNNIKQQLNYSLRTKFDPEQSISEDFKKPVRDIYETLKLINDEIDIGKKSSFLISDINHSVLFDPQSLAFYKKDNNAKLIKQYSEKYEELLNQSKFLHKGIFDHKNFSNVAKNLKENGFFKAEHQVIIKPKEKDDSFPTITSEEQLNKLLEKEKEKILNDAEIKKIFDKITSEIDANKGTKELDVYLQSKPELIIELENIEEFKKKIWIEVFRDNISEFKKLIELYDKTFEKIKEIYLEAKNQETRWGQVLTIFKERFHVPFKLEPSNQEDVILQNKMPIFNYIFEDKNNGARQIKENELLDILSTGEKRAYYLLDLIYKVEILRKEDKPALLILDDIADSFDYKNKYAIIEYINDIKNTFSLSGNKLFTIIILTHNFDFYRTLGSRLVNGRNCYISSETEDSIKLTPCNYIKNYFSYIKDQCLINSKTFIIAAIPFVRNLIEYTYSDTDPEITDYHRLTNLLHIKEDTYTISMNELQYIYNKYWLNNGGAFATEIKDSVVNIIVSEANKISSDPNLYNQVNIENKIVLSIAIRLKAEEYMMEQIKSHVTNGVNIIKEIQDNINQTGQLYSKYKQYVSNFSNNHCRHLEKVVMMTPENIHMNSFMYEPILDMQGVHLAELLATINCLE
ncbi:hypothetical protein [Dehalobacter sp. TBBPA1]|uniref:hypothetical protein n=1 Tax=Dehalobacter sp. TBBPA1 TaxID=3235037 RepID=UPI0034A1B2BF